MEIKKKLDEISAIINEEFEFCCRTENTCINHIIDIKALICGWQSFDNLDFMAIDISEIDSKKVLCQLQQCFSMRNKELEKEKLISLTRLFYELMGMVFVHVHVKMLEEFGMNAPKN